jgi:hypothetical protein
LTVIVALAMALCLVAAPVAAGQRFPTRIDLPASWMPEGITAGRGTTVYVGSLNGGGIWKADVRTGEGEQLVPAWGGPAVGVDYEKRADRLWVAGGPTGTVRVYDASDGSLLEQYDFSPVGFLNDLVVTRDAVYVTDSGHDWLDVIPLGKGGALPDPADVTTLPLTGIPVEADQFNLNGIVAARGWLIVVDSFEGGLYRVDPDTGEATQISTGGTSVARGDGLERVGSLLFVVRNFDQVIEVFLLGPQLRHARHLVTLDEDNAPAGLSVPTTVAAQAGRLWVVNARFGVPTTEYWVSRIP